ncbi:unnamed protein product [Pylaiella littoralis]
MVQLPLESPLRAQGVDTVIQVLGPNLDPRFPDCLTEEPDRARNLLRQCYDKTLAIFWEQALLAAAGGAVGNSATTGAAAAADAADAAAAGAGSENSQAAAMAVGKGTSGTKRKRPLPEYKKGPPVPAKLSGYWKTVLLHFLKDQDGPRPPELQNEVYFEDDQCVVIYDGYPKSRYHLLLLPKPKFLDVESPSELRRDQHLSRLHQLHATGAAVAEALTQQGAGVVRCGYHGIPSLKPLHLHIISQDFDSERMKKRSHWNSFTTDFFLEFSWVEARLQELGSLELHNLRLKDLEATPLRCFRCGRQMGNMTLLKNHNRGCTAPLSQRAAAGSGHGTVRMT